MRYLSIKALIALVVLPPVLYVGAIQGLEQFLAYHFRKEVQQAVPGDTQALLSGRTRLSDRIQTAVDQLLADGAFRHHGVHIFVTIRTQKGRRLYPPVYSDPLLSVPDNDAMDVASENFALLSEGLEISLAVTIEHNTLVANAVLAMALIIALAGLAIVYRRGIQVYARDESRRQAEETKIRVREESQRAALAALEEQRVHLASEVETIQTELTAAQERAARNEADLFDEVEALEGKLQHNLSQREKQQTRILELEEQLAQLAREREALSAQHSKEVDGLRKRMETLYKNTIFTSRALEGLNELTEAMQIKAEEIIHQLDAQADQVPIKRKLFRGKGKETVFEIVFAYKGRLYFRRTKSRKVDILVIGTKNSQEKDLVYLDRL
jgi:predicted  nucleic acid-binding Zn-ribbon protein